MLVIRMLAPKRMARVTQKRHDRIGVVGPGFAGEEGGPGLGAGGFCPIN
jgi:hypothetical protein